MSVLLIACCAHPVNTQNRPLKQKLTLTIIVCPRASRFLGSQWSGKRSSASQTRRSSTSPPKIECMRALFPEPGHKARAVEKSSLAGKIWGKTYRRICAGSSMSWSIGHCYVWTLRGGGQRSRLCRLARGICHLMHGRGTCLLGRGAERSGRGRRRCQDLYISRVSTPRPVWKYG
jgi:hypothetical protein